MSAFAPLMADKRTPQGLPNFMSTGLESDDDSRKNHPAPEQFPSRRRKRDKPHKSSLPEVGVCSAPLCFVLHRARDTHLNRFTSGGARRDHAAPFCSRAQNGSALTKAFQSATTCRSIS